MRFNPEFVARVQQSEDALKVNLMIFVHLFVAVRELAFVYILVVVFVM